MSITTISVVAALVIGTIGLVGFLTGPAVITCGPFAWISNIKPRLRRLRRRRPVPGRLAVRAGHVAIRTHRTTVVHGGHHTRRHTGCPGACRGNHRCDNDKAGLIVRVGKGRPGLFRCSAHPYSRPAKTLARLAPFHWRGRVVS